MSWADLGPWLERLHAAAAELQKVLGWLRALKDAQGDTDMASEPDEAKVVRVEIAEWTVRLEATVRELQRAVARLQEIQARNQQAAAQGQHGGAQTDGQSSGHDGAGTA